MKLENLQKKLIKLKLKFENNKIKIDDKNFIIIHSFEKNHASYFELNNLNIFFKNFNEVISFLKQANLLKNNQ